MDTTLADAAFRLVSHSLRSRYVGFRCPETVEARLTALRVEFPGNDRDSIADAYARAVQLEETAIAMADAFRGPGDGSHGPELTRQTLRERCPGFSEESYMWAVNDGFTQTRN